jgi:hypothetical protein
LDIISSTIFFCSVSINSINEKRVTSNKNKRLKRDVLPNKKPKSKETTPLL